MDEAARQIASSGILGAILVVLGTAYYRQGVALAAVQESRVADAQKVAQTLLAMQDRWQSVIGDLTDAVQRLPAGGEPAKPRRLT